MKISNILLLITGLLIISVLVTSNLSLKAEYEKADYRNPCYQCETMPLDEVTKLIIDAPRGAVFEILPSNTATLAYPQSWEDKVSVTQDQGVLTFTMMENPGNIGRGHVAYFRLPSFFHAVIQNHPTVTFRNFREKKLRIDFADEASVSLRRMRLDSLTITGADNGELTVGGCDTIPFLALTLTDMAKLNLSTTVVDSMRSRLDRQATIAFEGSVFDSFLHQTKK